MQGKKKIKITVVTPSFNSSSTIEDTIKSIIYQEYDNLEYIIMDGGSTDGTIQIIKKYHEHIAYWQSKPDKGQYDAIENGFNRSTGDIFFWLNADDMLLPKALHLVASIFNKFPEVHWISTLKPGQWDANGYFVGHYKTPGFSRQAFMDGLYLPGERRIGYWIQQESTFWRRQLWERAGSIIPTGYSLAGDFALWSKFYQYTDLYGVDYPLGGFRTIKGQRSESIDEYIQQATSALADFRQGQSPHVLTTLKYSKASRIRGIKSRIEKRFGYKGKRIYKEDIRNPVSEWVIHSHRFLP